MKKVNINSIEKLETFIKNEAISIESRFEVFVQALQGYDFFIMEFKYDDTCKEIENVEAVNKEMLRVISQIKDPDNTTLYGFAVSYKVN